MLHLKIPKKALSQAQIESDVLCLDTYVIRDKGCVGHCCQDPVNLESKLKIASAAGYSAVELWHRDVDGYIRQKGVSSLLNHLEANGLYVASYKVMEKWFEGDDDVSVLKTASDIRAKCCVVKLIGDNYQGPERPIEWYRSRYQKLLDIAHDLGVRPAIEFMALAPQMNSIDSVYDILEQTDDDYASVVLDTWHLWRNSDANFTHFKSSISRLRPEWVGVVHFTDARSEIPRQEQLDGHRRLPTLGCLDLIGFCRSLKAYCPNAVYSLNVYDRSLWNEDPMHVAVRGKYLTDQCIKAEGHVLADGNYWDDKQEERCDKLWHRQYYTHLDPRLSKTDRDIRLVELLSPILDGKVVLDFKCGFSPLAEYVSYGFDAYKGCIDYLTKQYPNASWMCMSDKDFANTFREPLDVLLHIGLGDSNTEEASHMLIRERCQPKTVVIECAANSDGTVNESKPGNTARWNNLKRDLVNIKEHVIHTDMAERSHRLLLIGDLPC